MKQSSKQETILKRKPLKGQINRQVKFVPKQQQSQSPLLSNIQSELKNTKSKIKQNESIQNVSLIEGSSFISNKQDGSLDSMDKMLIGVTAMGIDQKQFEQQNQSNTEQKSKGSVTDFDFNQIHKQYEKLIGRNELLGEQEEEVSDEIQQNSRVLPYQDQWQVKQPNTLQKKLQKLSSSLSPKKRQYFLGFSHSSYSESQIKMHLQRIQFKVDQMKSKKLQDLSNNSIKILAVNLGNLSEIHQQKENNLNHSKDTDRKRNNEEDEQDFIDFVGLPDPQQNNQNVQKKNYFTDENQVNQWQVSPMFQNLQLLLQKQKQTKKVEKSANYQQILQALNSKQEQQAPNEYLEFFVKRQNWIKSQKTKSENWKKKELNLLNKMKKIMKNPQYDSDDSEQQH